MTAVKCVAALFWLRRTRDVIVARKFFDVNELNPFIKCAKLRLNICVEKKRNGVKKLKIQNEDLLLSISLNQIHVFLVAAEYENFSRAARVLHLSQAAVSKTITTLEEKTGVVLFSRYVSYVSLTPAGKALRTAWEKIYQITVNSVERAKMIQKESFTTLKVGDCRELKGNLFLCPELHDIAGEYPEVEMSYTQESLAFLLDDLYIGKFDLVFCSSFDREAAQRLGFHSKVVVPDRMCIAVNKEHPLAKREKLEIKDLRNETVILVNPDIWENYYRKVHELFGLEGIKLEKEQIHLTDTVNAAFLSMYNREGILLCDEMFYPSYNSYIKKYVITDHDWGIIAVWSEKNANPWVKIFLDQLCQKQIKHI